MKTIVLSLALATALCACPPQPQPPGPDASDAQGPSIDDAAPVPSPVDAALPVDAAPPSVVAAACANLAALGCPEGGAVCATVLQHAANGTFALSPACIAASKTVSAVRACNVQCAGR